ncbi:hypothetical protein M011DRAFT_110684 [Sporormia fimetaria CBS 119925]|uniref:Secreted protein n=1 Tax=Sporormia fimetaria CBS 119925 TaxID=1340428 RepID=A0A6A6VNC3_9PLEO|nr:hypothetical protein M011DRAFT_110684 [Sporormia fimetaria CBS 119925]
MHESWCREPWLRWWAWLCELWVCVHRCTSVAGRRGPTWRWKLWSSLLEGGTPSWRCTHDTPLRRREIRGEVRRRGGGTL